MKYQKKIRKVVLIIKKIKNLINIKSLTSIDFFFAFFKFFSCFIDNIFRSDKDNYFSIVFITLEIAVEYNILGIS